MYDNCYWLRWTIQLLEEVQPVGFSILTSTSSSSVYRLCYYASRYFLYYKLYGISLVNLFLMTSTWLIILMSISRYIVVAYPLHARSGLSTSTTRAAILLVCNSIKASKIKIWSQCHTRRRMGGLGGCYLRATHNHMLHTQSLLATLTTWEAIL